jgi:hypothetical protein
MRSQENDCGLQAVDLCNLRNSVGVTATREAVSDLPNSGQTAYARLYSLINGAWQLADYTYSVLNIE